jgi:hypothetical protein
VRWNDSSLLAQLGQIATASSFYRNEPDQLRKMIEEVLQADVRSKDQTKKRQSSGPTEIVLDNARVGFREVSASATIPGTTTQNWIEVISIQHVAR